MALADISIGIAVTGARISASTTSARIAVPKTSSGGNPKYVRVAASALTYVRLFGGSGNTAVNTDTAVQPGDSVVFRVPGYADTTDGKIYIAAIAETGTSVVQVSPLEDF